MKKYELTAECKDFLGRKLYRIRALIDFDIVEEGDLGGWIEKEENLSQEGNAWVYDNARVYGDAEIRKRTHLLEIGFIGSRDDVTTFFRTKNKEIFVKCGCFSGNIDDFEKQVREVHGENKHGKVYALAIAMAKEQIELEDEDVEEEEVSRWKS